MSSAVRRQGPNITGSLNGANGSSGVSNTDGTVLNGDLGDYPSGAASIMLRTIHAGDITSNAAKMDAWNAYILPKGD